MGLPRSLCSGPGQDHEDHHHATHSKALQGPSANRSPGVLSRSCCRHLQQRAVGPDHVRSRSIALWLGEDACLVEPRLKVYLASCAGGGTSMLRSWPKVGRPSCCRRSLSNSQTEVPPKPRIVSASMSQLNQPRRWGSCVRKLNQHKSLIRPLIKPRWDVRNLKMLVCPSNLRICGPDAIPADAQSYEFRGSPGQRDFRSFPEGLVMCRAPAAVACRACGASFGVDVLTKLWCYRHDQRSSLACLHWQTVLLAQAPAPRKRQHGRKKQEHSIEPIEAAVATGGSLQGKTQPPKRPSKR